MRPDWRHRRGGIVAVEIDRDLAGALPTHVPSNVRVVTGDFLNVDLDEVLRDEPRPVRVIGNLPYNVSSPILFRLLHAADHGRRFRDATLMLQKEVADRITATAGTTGYGTLARATRSGKYDCERPLTRFWLFLRERRFHLLQPRKSWHTKELHR